MQWPYTVITFLAAFFFTTRQEVTKYGKCILSHGLIIDKVCHCTEVIASVTGKQRGICMFCSLGWRGKGKKEIGQLYFK